MLKRLFHGIRDHFRSEEEKSAEDREVALYARDVARREFGIAIPDGEVELYVHFQRACRRCRGKKGFRAKERAMAQMFAWLPYEGKRELVVAMQDWLIGRSPAIPTAK